MIPEFPDFKKLELSDKKDIEKFTSKFPPYSDFNFTSMWIWDISGKMRISSLNKNLVVLFSDYVSGDIFLSFIGDQKVLETTYKLIEFSNKNYFVNFVKLIPEEIFLELKKAELTIKNDRDSYDYIYLTEHLATMDKWSSHAPMREIKKFIKLYPNFVFKESSIKDILPNDYKKKFERWSISKNIKDDFESNEYKAFKRLLKLKDENIIFVSIFLNEILIGFSVYEILSKKYAIAHFSKADSKNYPGIFTLLNWEEGKFFLKRGIKYLNWEQDLGLQGLRYFKEKFKPCFLMRKLIVSL